MQGLYFDAVIIITKTSYIIRSYKFLCKKPLRSVREAKYVTVKVLTGRET